MKKIRILGTVLAASVALGAFGGCSLVSHNSAKDMRQVIAEVNISRASDVSESDKALFDKYKDAVGTSQIYKNKLIAYYLNVGASMSGQYSNSEIFSNLVGALVDNAVVTQYAVMYVLDYKSANGESDALEKYNACETYEEKLEYLLKDGDDEKYVNVAKYNLYSSINAAIDTLELSLLEEDGGSAGTETRTAPGGVDTEQENYYPATADGDLDYNVYTGYEGNLLADSGAYQDDPIEGTTKATRNEAYITFMDRLASYGLVNPRTDNVLDFENVPYIKEEYVSQLESRVVAKYYDLYEKEQEKRLTDEGEYEYIKKTYQDMLESQTRSYDTTEAFDGVIGSLSDSSFILYSPDTEGEGAYGLVYNILLPFDSIQTNALAAMQSNPAYKDKDSGDYTIDYYLGRNELLKNIRTTDQRSAWFNGATDYSFSVKTDKNGKERAADDPAKLLDFYGKNSGREYLFFENNILHGDRYEALDRYIGKYAYNGKVYVKYDEDGDRDGYTLVPEKLSIDGMLSEFKAYVDYVCGADTVKFEGGYTAGVQNDSYYTSLTEANFFTEETRGKKPAEREIDYNNFIYAKGSVNVGSGDTKSYKGDLLQSDSAQYKALAAINELQYAYTTDVSVLSEYLGYSVKLGDSTGYIKEFEAAAHEAIARGEGAFNVCAGDYGWHILYVTYVYSADGGEIYEPSFTPERVDKKGTFENLFYEYKKSQDIASISSTRETQILTQFRKDSTVTTYQSRYQDLLDL